MSVVVGSGGGDGGDAPTAKEAWFAVNNISATAHALVTLQTLSRLLEKAAAERRAATTAAARGRARRAAAARRRSRRSRTRGGARACSTSRDGGRKDLVGLRTPLRCSRARRSADAFAVAAAPGAAVDAEGGPPAPARGARGGAAPAAAQQRRRRRRRPRRQATAACREPVDASAPRRSRRCRRLRGSDRRARRRGFVRGTKAPIAAARNRRRPTVGSAAAPPNSGGSAPRLARPSATCRWSLRRRPLPSTILLS